MRILKEPLLHFILIGAAIFCWFAWISPQNETVEDIDTITIDENDISVLRTRFEASWNRPPTEEEVQALIDASIREEVLVREARKLGLDQDDQVIRARLAQKMDFLTDAIAASVEPEPEVLQAFLEGNPERFATSAQLAFEQVFLGETAEHDAVASAINEADTGDTWRSMGTATLLPRSMPLTVTRVIDANFGNGFSSELAMQETGIWFGPVQSAYGTHIVRVTEKTAAELPPLKDIKDAVLLEWRRETGAELAKAQYESFASHYRVVTPNAGQTFE